jgi:hypothetical protein
MPFAIVCPSCDARLQAPDELAGKRVKCKKCGESFVVRRAEDEDHRPARPAKAPGVAARPRREDEEDEDDAPRRPAKAARSRDDDADEDRPRRPRENDNDDEPQPKKRRKKRKKKVGPPVALFVAIGVGAVVLIGGVAGLIYYLSGDKKSDTPVAQGGAQPKAPGPKTPAVDVGGADTSGWVEHSDPEGRYRVRMPKQPDSARPFRLGLPSGELLEIRLRGTGSGAEGFAVGHGMLPAGLVGKSSDEILGNSFDTSKAGVPGTVKSHMAVQYQGFSGIQAVIEVDGKKGSAVVRMIVANDRVIMLLSAGENVSAEGARVKTFFESLKIE